jgi:hypothetical protein
MENTRIDPSKVYLVRGKTLQRMQDDIDSLWGGDNIQTGPGILRRGSGDAGFSLASKPGSARAPAPPSSNSFPFKIRVRTNPSNPALLQRMVNPDSTVMLSGKPNDNLSVTGLGVWESFIANDVIALFIVVASGVAMSATIQSYGAGNTTFDPNLSAWDASDQSFVFDDGGTPPLQIGINILIGYSTPDAHGKPFLVQAQSTHILLEQDVIMGRAALFDFSHRERYGITAP